MRKRITALRGGAFLTRERVRRVAWAAVAASGAALLFLLATSPDGLSDRLGRPLGTDFSSFYAAGALAREGQPAAAYDVAAHHARQQAIFGAGTPFYGWLYPPLFLALAAALAAMPYGVALLAWQGASLGAYLASMRAIAARASAAPDPLWPLLALGFPAVFVNLGHGQNGFLSAALLAGGLLALERRPRLAGVLFGCLAYKPQLGLLIPLALLAGGYGRALLAGGVTVALLVSSSVAAFGAETWRAFFASTHFTRTVLLEAGDVGWEKIQSVFAALRMWGGSVPLAYAAQALVALAVALALLRVWRGSAPFALKAAALCLGTILATPFSLDYDLMLLAPALALLLAHGARCGFASYEKSAIAVAWLVPLVSRSIAEVALLPLGSLATASLFVLTARRAESTEPGFTPPTAAAILPPRPAGGCAHDRPLLLDDAERPQGYDLFRGKRAALPHHPGEHPQGRAVQA